MKTKKIIKASFFHSPTYGDIEFLEHAILLVSDNGIISEIIRKEDVTELQKNLEKLQDQRSDVADQISSIQHLKDRDSMQMLHHLNLEQSSIQNNILSIKTQMTEMVQA